MQCKIFFYAAAALVLHGRVRAQEAYGPVIPQYIKPFPLAVTINKTTNLLFHYRIKNVDVASPDISAQQINDTSLLVTATKENFKETNLSVYTSDGRLHAFLVNYAVAPAQLNILVSIGDSTGRLGGQPSGLIQTDDALAFYSTKALQGPLRWHRHNTAYEVSVRLLGLYTRQNILLFSIRLRNRSSLDYDIDQLRFFIRDKKKGKRTATQETEVKPVFVLGDISSLPGESNHGVVLALPKFTLPDKKYLRIVLMEKDGGRTLQLRLRNKTLIRARSL